MKHNHLILYKWVQEVNVIIEDYEYFCKPIIEEYTKDKSSIYTVVHYFQGSIMSMLFYLVTCVLFFKIFHIKFNTGINTGLWIFAIEYAFIFKLFTHNIKQRTFGLIFYYFCFGDK